MTIASVAGLVKAVEQDRLLGPQQLDELHRRLCPRFQDAHTLARELLRRGWLTPYQVNQLLQGHGKDLVLGHYVLLERLGEGGMGVVYKARHQTLHNIVALKLLRKQLTADRDAARRFQQEIFAAAQLSHPNIVRAYDADEVEGGLFYTMEYVEGTTLGDLVGNSGPLLVALAAEYIRQAALGLQHAHERGLVHRDIKPSNLILSWTSQSCDPAAGREVEDRMRAQWGGNAPVIKIFDMGLARVRIPRRKADCSGSITEKGTLMGTPDFIAPEQALDAKRADIRSDLYSLGATFYCLLTAQVPFPGETTMAKVFHHQLDEPRPIQELRPGVPPDLQAVVRKLMAKRPEQRYQTPAELATALAAFLAHQELHLARKVGR